MNKINIAELLKDCPKGMELDCTMYEDVYFDYVDELNMIHCYIQHETYRTSLTFNQHGTPNSNTKSKCVIFPKGKTTWEGFTPPCKFKDGDIITMENECGIHIFIYNYTTDEYNGYGSYVVFTSLGNFKINCFCSGSTYRLATEEEKERLFDAIKANGYKWNPETKTLEKLPKFNVGDRVRNKNYKDYIYDIHDITDKGYRAKEIDADSPIIILFGSEEDNYELVPNKFDINTLKPYDKVLYRMHDKDTWCNSFYSFYKSNHHFVTSLTIVKQCIPYEGNEHLCGTTDDCNEYFKTWE